MTQTLAFGWVPSDGENGIAIALRNTETVVYGNTTGKPNVGDVLTAIDSTHMKWQVSAPSVGTWANVLITGNTSGATNPTISAGQRLLFTSDVIINPAVNGTIRVGNANAAGTNALAVGNVTTASGNENITIGYNSVGTGLNSILFGSGNVDNGFSNCMLLGKNVSASANNQIIIGNSTNAISTDASLSFSTGLAANSTTRLLTVPRLVNTPTGASPTASIVYDDTNNLFYGKKAAGWVSFQTGSDTLTTVLTNGNNTGAFDINVTNSQKIQFTTGIRIGGNGVAVGTVSTGGISIGALSTAPNTSGISIGTSSVITSTSPGAICIGASNTVLGTSDNAVSLGFTTTIGTGCNDSIIVGSNSTLSNTSSASIIVGSNSTVSKFDTVNVGNDISNLAEGTIIIGKSSSTTALAINSITIGRGLTNESDGTILIGRSSTTRPQDNSNVMIGNGIVSGAGGPGNLRNVLLGEGSSFQAGGGATDSVGLMPGTVIEAGVSNRIYANAAWAGSTDLPGVMVHVNALTGRLYPSFSSIRFKHNVQDLDEPERILKLRARTYNMKAGSCGCVNKDCDGFCKKSSPGYIAEEVAEAGLPDFTINYEKDGKTEYMAVQYDKLVCPIIEVLKQQQKKIELLEAAILELHSMIE